MTRLKIHRISQIRGRRLTGLTGLPGLAAKIRALIYMNGINQKLRREKATPHAPGPQASEAAKAVVG